VDSVIEEAPLLVIEGVSKRFGATQALSDVDLTLRSGEIHALVGENGAGKSTLIRLMTGIYQADEDAMTLDGQPFAPRNRLRHQRGPTQQVDVIMVSNNAGDQLGPAAAAAQEAGIPVVTWDSPIPSVEGESVYIAPGGRDEADRWLATAS
jgi:ABC-type glutathione transport system ATPase component